jgi:hypothetical protein
VDFSHFTIELRGQGFCNYMQVYQMNVRLWSFSPYFITNQSNYFTVNNFQLSGIYPVSKQIAPLYLAMTGE